FGIAFQVDAVWSEEERACVLVSRAPDPDGARVRQGKLSGAFDEVVGNDRRWRLTWDHSAVCPWLAYSVGGEAPGPLRSELTGPCGFRALGSLVPRPAFRVAILRGLLREKPSALARWSRLRLLVVLYRLPITWIRSVGRVVLRQLYRAYFAL